MPVTSLFLNEKFGYGVYQVSFKSLFCTWYEFDTYRQELNTNISADSRVKHEKVHAGSFHVENVDELHTDQ